MNEIHPDLSDLFFNHDVTDAKRFDRHGRFTDFDDGDLFRLAADFCDALRRLGVVDVPAPARLVRDFRSRF